MKTKTCTKCKEEKSLEDFYFRKDRQSYYTCCKSCQSHSVKKRWPNFKQTCVDYKGGKCEICGYCKYIGALDFHHLDPKEKDFAISSRVSMKLENIKKELDKCVMLCSNCHRETHAGLTKF